MQVSKITVAVNDMDAMVGFYNGVFGSGMASIPGTPFYVGALAGMTLMFCPNDIAQVEAKKNRTQFGFLVDDVEAVVASARAHGGAAFGERQDNDGVIAWGIADPDGNSIELVERK